MRALPLLLLMSLAAVTLPSGAVAARAKGNEKDKKAPLIEHVPVALALAGQELVVEAKIVDPSSVFDPAVLYRVAGAVDYLRVPMTKIEGRPDVYAARLPVQAAGSIEYMLEAFDGEGNGPARAGDAEHPLTVVVAAATTPAAATEPAAAAAPVTAEATTAPADGAEDDGGAGLWIGVGVGAGALVAVAAVAAGAVAFYALRTKTPTSVTLTVEGPTPFSLVAATASDDAARSGE